MKANRTIALNNGVKIPALGYGTNVLRVQNGIDAIKTALNVGYRLIDTAQSYENEDIVGQAVIESSVPRNEVFLTTKIDDNNQGYQSTVNSLKHSLNNLHTDYVDLLLIHWPYLEDFDRSLDTWQALIDLQSQGKTRAIGVSNYTPELIQLTIQASGVVPAVNQVEFHPFLYQNELLQYCQSENILIEAYCPIARAKYSDNPVLQRLGTKYGKSPVQIILRWHLEHRVVPIPRSTNPNHIKANIDVFDFSLSADDVAEIDTLHNNLRIVNPEKGPESWKV